MPPSRAKVSAVSKRRADAIELKIAGVDIVTIGKRLAADPALNIDGLGYPEGYGCDRYKAGRPYPNDDELAALVSEDLSRALKERRARLEHDVETLRAIEDTRLDRMTYIAFRAALAGDLSAIDRVLRLSERRSKLLGLDAPTRTQVGLSEDVDAEIDRLMLAIAKGDEAVG